MPKIKKTIIEFASKNSTGRQTVKSAVKAKNTVRRSAFKFKKYYINIVDYRNTAELRNIKIVRTKLNYVVVLHLYYSESWPLVLKKLLLLKNFDLIVTIPKKNTYIISKIKEQYSEATVIVIPNRGRDVMGFTLLLEKIQSAGYVYLLKIHSKKSTHRSDGFEWFNDMLDKLIPDNERTLEKIHKTLENSTTSIIGPEGHYVSLDTNFEQNKHYLNIYLEAIYGAKSTNKILVEHKKYGFFAGTMFWARIDSFNLLIKQNIKFYDFDLEKRQIDSTLAHSFERLFCLIPEIEDKMLYEISSSAIINIDYKTSYIPDWSDVYIGPK